MPARDHRQRGARIGVCSECGKAVWSNQPSRIVSATPLVIVHERCP